MTLRAESCISEYCNKKLNEIQFFNIKIFTYKVKTEYQTLNIERTKLNFENFENLYLIQQNYYKIKYF